VPPEPGDPKESTRSETTMADGGDAPISDAVVGRDDELTIISQALDSAADSRGQVVVLAGEAGIGKTFLLSHTLKSAEKRGFRVINATCSSLPGAPPLWPWEVALGQDPALSDVLDSLKRLQSEMMSDDQSEADLARRFELFSTIAAAINRPDRSVPIVIAIDDMHWADTTSLDLFSFFGTQIASGPIVLLGCLRTADQTSSQGVEATLAELGRLPNCVRVEPKVLDHSGVHKLVEATVGHSVARQVVEQIADQSRGLPLFVRELGRMVELRGQKLDGVLPSTISELLGSQFDRLTPTARQVLTAGALVGTTFNSDLVVQILSRMDHPEQVVLTSDQLLMIVDWCDGATGVWVYEVGTPAFTGAKFDYELKSDPGGSWNTIVAVVKFHDKKLYDLMNYAGGDGFRIGLAPSGVMEDWEAFESPGC
jgi:predicted ATPase